MEYKDMASIIIGILVLINGIISLINGRKVKNVATKVEEIHVVVNGRLSTLLDLTKQVSKEEGRVNGVAEGVALEKKRSNLEKN